MPKKPVIYELASDELVKKYIEESDALIREILEAKSEVEISGTTYYVSMSEGDDNNDGLSPESAWKTIEKVNKTEKKPGDGILLKRGDEWRIRDALDITSGITLSAYGEGKKPRLNGSIDASSPDDWEETEYENVWHYTKKTGGFMHNVGCIIFDKGRAWGVLVTPVKSGNRRDNGIVFNGLERYECDKGVFEWEKSLSNNLEFCHKISEEDPNVDELWLYCREGNPGKVFSSVELADRGSLVRLVPDPEIKWACDIVVDNIDMYGACFGVYSNNVRNVTIQYCTFRWIGGQVQGIFLFGSQGYVRYGNAIESYGRSDGFTMRYNYASQAYDCCWTAQCASKVEFNNVQIYKNVAEFSNTGPEVWIGDGGSVTNLQIHDNYNRFIGYGWSHQRPTGHPSGDKKAAGWRGAGGSFYGAQVSHTFEGSVFKGNDVYNNVNLFSGSSLGLGRFVHKDTYNFHDNINILEEGKGIGRIVPSEKFNEYTKDELTRIVEAGYLPGSEFYYTRKNPLGDMYKLCLPGNGIVK